ncbi:MAG: DUF1501 domain-containing protein [Gemmataceae bacterium]
MLTIPATRSTRRDFLQIGTLALGGLTLGDLLSSHAADTPARRKSVIVVFLAGGPSQLDTYDMKPDAPAEYRGEFRPAASRIAGMPMCELLPLQAKSADKLAILRGVKLAGGHGSYEVHTGFRRQGRPVLGAVVSRLLGTSHNGMPSYISVNGRSGAEYADPIDPAYLGAAHRAFVPSGPDLRNLQLSRDMTLDRLADRKLLLRSFDDLRQDLDARGELAGMDAFTRQALEMIVSPQVREALDVRREPEAARARYGEEGSSFLLARRLVEAGVSVVTLAAGFPRGKQDKDVVGNWDTHRNNFVSLRWKLPAYDQALSSLIDDLHERGLANDVCVLVCGEMGRTPRVGQSTGATTAPDGRDHWEIGCALMAGGGLRTGQVIGSTDARGERPLNRPYTMQNLLATVYHVLGIDPATTFLDHSGRPQYVLDDRAKVAELV